MGAMHRVGSEESSTINTFTNRNIINNQESNQQKSWNLISIISEIERIEVWSSKIAANLASNSTSKSKSNSKPLIWFLNSFLWIFTIRLILSQILIGDNQLDLLLIFGDLSPFYGLYINRLYFNTFVICWGFHAALVYSLITRHNGEKREWLMRFEDCWSKSSYRIENKENNEKQIISIRNICITAIKSSVLLYLVLLITTNSIGAYKSFNKLDQSLYIYIIWTVTYCFWCIVTTTINVTSLAHHYIICRSIILRFRETTIDLECAIKNRSASVSSSSSIDVAIIISKLLTKHYTTCDMVIEANRFLKNYLFVFYLFFGPHLCFLVYQMFFATISYAAKAVVTFYICADALQIILVSLSSAKVTSVAHKPYHVVHGVGKMSIPEDIQLQICTAIVTYFSIIVEMN